MSYLKNIIEDMLNIPVDQFYKTSLSAMKLEHVELIKQCVKESTNSMEQLNEFIREFSTVKIELDNLYDEKSFTKYIDDKCVDINAKFKFSYFINGASDMILLGSRILSCIDGELNKPGSHYSEILKYYNILRTEILTSYKSMAVKFDVSERKFNRPDLNISLIDAIKFLTCPYLVNRECTNRPVEPYYMYMILFDQDTLINEYFTFGDAQFDNIAPYNIYGDAFYSFNQDMIDGKINSVPKEIGEIYVKTIVTLQIIFHVLKEYFLDIQDFCKKYYLACSGEYKFEVDDKYEITNLKDYPETLNDFNRFIFAEEAEDYVKSSEADSDAGALSSQNTSMTPPTTANNVSLDQIDEKYKQKSLKLQK